MAKRKNNTQILRQLVKDLSPLEQVILVEMISTMSVERIKHINCDPAAYNVIFHWTEWLKTTEKIKSIVDQNNDK